MQANEAIPTFVRALRGIWLFTWKSQWTWQRLPLRVISLLVLPVLIYITTTRNLQLGHPESKFNHFSHRLERAHLELNPEQRTKLLQIFREEFQRAQDEWTAAPRSSASETDADRQTRAVTACYARIGERAKPVLDERQFAQFQRFETQNVTSSQERASNPEWRWSTPFYRWLINFYFFIILPLGCVRATGALIRDELQADTLGFLVTRPLTRARLLAVKYLSQTAWLQIVFFVQTLLLFAAGGLRHVPELGALLPLFLAAQILAVPAWSALGTFFGLVTRRYIALALLYGLIVEMGIGKIPTNINALSLMRHLKTLLAHHAPLQTLYEWPLTSVPLAIAALLLATGLFTALAACLFTFFEYHHSAEMQK